VTASSVVSSVGSPGVVMMETAGDVVVVCWLAVAVALSVLDCVAAVP